MLNLTKKDIGESLIDEDGDECVILDVRGVLVDLSGWKSFGNNWRERFDCTRHVEELREAGWKLKETEPTKLERFEEFIREEVDTWNLQHEDIIDKAKELWGEE